MIAFSKALRKQNISNWARVLHIGMTKKVGIYEIGKTLGEGSFGLVRLATNTKTKETVAMKIIEKEKIKREDLLHHLKKEVQFLMMIDHPNITKLIEVLASKTKIYLVLEYISGGELWDLVKSKGKLDDDSSRKYFRQIIRALDYCRQKNIAHRDLKPENILLDEQGDLKVSDFGLSELCKDHSNFTQLLHTTCGTLNYLAPEVIQNVGYDGHLADIWSCGVILYFLLSGELPFEDDSVPVLLEKIGAKGTTLTVLAINSVDLLEKILNPNPKKRATLDEIKKHPWFLEKITQREQAAFEEDRRKLLAEKQNQVNSSNQGPLESFVSNVTEDFVLEKQPGLTFSLPLMIINSMGETEVISDNLHNYPAVPKKMNAFELANFLSGVLINRIFDIEIVKNSDTSKGQSLSADGKRKASALGANEVLDQFTSKKPLLEILNTVKEALMKSNPTGIFRFDPADGLKIKSVYKRGKEQLTIIGEIFDIGGEMYLLNFYKGQEGTLKQFIKLYEEIFSNLSSLVCTKN